MICEISTLNGNTWEDVFQKLIPFKLSPKKPLKYKFSQKKPSDKAFKTKNNSFIDFIVGFWITLLIPQLKFVLLNSQVLNWFDLTSIKCFKNM